MSEQAQPSLAVAAGSLAEDEWSLVIRPKRGWFEIDFRDLWRYRDLILLFVRRDFVAIYRQTILGPFWFLITPLVSSGVFTVVFGKVAAIPTDGIPQFLFYYSGLTCWNYFAQCVNGTSNSFLTNSGLYGKVFFPRLVSPISVVIAAILSFGIQFIGLLIMLGVFWLRGWSPSIGPSVFLIPFLVFEMALLGLGIGLLISAATTKYRDFSYLLGFGLQLWMYASPIVYPFSQVPHRYQALYSLNPMVAVIGSFRSLFLGTPAPAFGVVLSSCFVTLALAGVGVLMFHRAEQNFVDVV